MSLFNTPFDEMGEADLDFLSERGSNAHAVPPGAERVELLQEGRFSAHAHDLGFAWRWAILRDGREIQEGPALSLASAERSARHALSFYVQIDHRGAA